MSLKKPHLQFKTFSLITLTLIMVSLLWSNSVFAQGLGTANGSLTESLSDATFNFLGTILNLLYIVTLPILILAGKAMDNSMIYGEFMNLDKPLLMLRNMSRTLANFAIGGVLLWKVFNYIFSKENNGPAFLKDLIIKSIGVVLAINMSRFALGALLDLSTIATYSLGAMPLGAIKEVNGDKDMPILSVVSYFDFQSQSAINTAGTLKNIPQYHYYKRGTINIPTCENTYYGIVLGPKEYPTITNKPDVSFTGRNIGTGRQYCVLNSQTLADITDLEVWKDNNLTGTIYNGKRENNAQRNLLMKNIIEKLNQSTGCNQDMPLAGESGTTGNIIGSNIMELSTILKFGETNRSTHTFCENTTPLIINKNAYNETGWQSDFLKGGKEPYSSEESQTVKNLMNQSKGMVGPFVTLYMTLLNFSNLSNIQTNDASINNTIGGLLEFTLKAAISIAVFIPLVALAAMLIIRVILLWGIIAFMPLGIIYMAFEKDIPAGLKGGGGMKKPDWMGDIDAKGIIGLIFAPIIPVFVLSISIIILQTFQIELSKSMNSENKTRAFFGISSNVNKDDPSITCTDFWGLQELCYKSDPETNVGSAFSNLMPRLFLNFFGIALIWFMMKMAMGSTGILSKVGGNLMDLGGQALGAIPIPGMGGITAGTIARSPEILSRVSNDTIGAMRRKEDEALSKLFNKGKDTASENQNTPTSNSITIKNKDNVKKSMIAPASITKLNDSVDTRLQYFGETLEKEDKEASAQFKSLSPENQSQALLDYIESDLKDRTDIDKKKLIERILQPQLKAINSETDQDKSKALKTKLKTFIENNKNLGDGKSIIALFKTTPYEKILEDMFP